NAQEIVERIRQKIGIEWKSETVDTFKAGDSSVAVKGIVTSAMATLPVLEQAAKIGANLIITCGATFFFKSDNASPPVGRGAAPTGAADHVFKAKNEFIKSEGLVVWRFSDHWRQRKPDPLAIGLGDALGWSKLRSATDATRLTIPEITLEALATD